MKRNRSAAEWFSLISSWQDSGMAKTEFSKAHNFSEATFYRWHKRFLHQTGSGGKLEVIPGNPKPQKPASSFVEVKFPCPENLPGNLDARRVLKIKTSYGCLLEIPL